MRSYTAKPADITRKWLVIDAEGVVLGRLATKVAMILRGKHKATYTPHMDVGDNVIIVNAEKVKLTGNKLTDKVYYWHTGYAGGIKSRTPEKLLSGAYPERVIEKAVERMMPKDSPLARAQFRKLHIYKGAAHPHEAQQPEALDLSKLNAKNKR